MHPTQPETNSRAIKLLLLAAIIGTVLMFVALGSIEPTPEPATNRIAASQSEPPKPAAPKTWQKVVELTGTANKRSDIFHLQGSQQRITYALNGTTYPMLYLYVIEANKTLENNGGFAELMINEAGSGETMSYRGAGDYYLDTTSANGDWTITVEELK